MKKQVTFLVVLFASIAVCLFALNANRSASPIPAGERAYRLVWQEDFNGRELDQTNWNKIQRNWPEWCKYMSDNESLYELKKGRMRLYARVNDGIEPSDTAPFLTGGISTLHKRTFTYGKIEVRARIKGAMGCWPAIWIKDDDRSTPSYKEQAEIDIMEHYNHDDFVHFSVHNTHTLVDKRTKDPVSTVKAAIKKGKYNIYAVEILPERIVYSVNNKVVHEYPKVEKYGFKQYPYGSKCYLMIDMQVGNPWLKDIRKAEYPAYMDVDWVKIYEPVLE